MKLKQCLPLWAITAFFMSACYKDINLEKYRPEPTLVINCVASPDTIVMAKVSQTVFFTDHRHTDSNIVDAEVGLTVNGRFVQTMEYDGGSRMYLSGYRPQASDTIKLEADCVAGHASGECHIPEAVSIENVKLATRVFDDPDQIIWSPEGAVYGKSYEVTYHITFTDDPDRRNYYFIRIEGANGIAAETIDYSHDEVFLAQQSSIDGITTDTGIYGNEGRTFTDDLFDGNSYTLKIMEKAPLYTEQDTPRPRKIILYSLSEDYYHYLTGIFNTDEGSVSGTLEDMGFSEPSPHYTNITGGTGIIGGVQSRSYRLELRFSK